MGETIDHGPRGFTCARRGDEIAYGWSCNCPEQPKGSVAPPRIGNCGKCGRESPVGYRTCTHCWPKPERTCSCGRPMYNANICPTCAREDAEDGRRYS